MGSATINLSAVIDTIGGTARAPLSFTAQVMRGGQPALRVDGAQAVIPAPLAWYWSGTAWAPSEPVLTDVDLDCHWLVELATIDGNTRLTRTVVLPVGYGARVDFGALTVVDPSTLVPTSSAVAGWAATQALAQQVKASFDALVAGAPSALDTFLEIATEFATDETGLAALTAALAAKADAATVAATYVTYDGTNLLKNGTVIPITGSAGGGSLSVVDNGDGTLTITPSAGVSITDNGDGSLTLVA